MNIPYDWIWWIGQLAIDIILLIALFVLLSKLKKAKGGNMGEQTTLSAQDFVEQAGQLAREFDRLLGEKRELVGTTLSTLDARIDELRAMLEQAKAQHSKLQQVAASLPPQAAPQPATTSPAQASSRNTGFVALPEDEDPFNLPPGHPLNQVADEPNKPSLEQDFRQQVIKLHGLGRSPQEIALSTGHPRAEVELLLALIK